MPDMGSNTILKIKQNIIRPKVKLPINPYEIW